MQILKAMKEEYKAIIKDIQENPNRIKDYDLVAMYEELHRKEIEVEYKYNDCIYNKCEHVLLQNNRYIKLSNLSIQLFNSLKDTADIDLLFRYEDVMSQMQEMVELEAYNLGKKDPY